MNTSDDTIKYNKVRTARYQGKRREKRVFYRVGGTDRSVCSCGYSVAFFERRETKMTPKSYVCTRRASSRSKETLTGSMEKRGGDNKICCVKRHHLTS